MRKINAKYNREISWWFVTKSTATQEQNDPEKFQIQLQFEDISDVFTENQILDEFIINIQNNRLFDVGKPWTVFKNLIWILIYLGESPAPINHSQPNISNLEPNSKFQNTAEQIIEL